MVKKLKRRNWHNWPQVGGKENMHRVNTLGNICMATQNQKRQEEETQTKSYVQVLKDITNKQTSIPVSNKSSITIQNENKIIGGNNSIQRQPSTTQGNRLNDEEITQYQTNISKINILSLLEFVKDPQIMEKIVEFISLNITKAAINQEQNEEHFSQTRGRRYKTMREN